MTATLNDVAKKKQRLSRAAECGRVVGYVKDLRHGFPRTRRGAGSARKQPFAGRDALGFLLG